MIHDIAFYLGATLFCGFPLIIASVVIIIGAYGRRQDRPCCDCGKRMTSKEVHAMSYIYEGAVKVQPFCSKCLAAMAVQWEEEYAETYEGPEDF